MEPAEPLRQGKSFLDFPNEVRHRIYELVIYDQDRSVVFLPRAVPRKVTPDTDVDVKYAIVMEEGDEDKPNYFAWPVNSNNAFAAGEWMDGTTPFPNRPSQRGSQDSEPESEPESDTTVADAPNDAGTQSDSDSVSDTDALNNAGAANDTYANEDVLAMVDALHLCEGEDQDEPCDCDCYNDGFDMSNHTADDLFTAWTCGGVDDDEPCGRTCHKDVSDEDAPEEGESESDDDVDIVTNDHDYANSEPESEQQEDDEEHYDGEERIGMLYELNEPPMLLVCREIRAQCLPVYYGKNSFSWRFLWQNYPRSRERYNNWIDAIREEDLKAMTSLTLEGRHFVEEGIEFSADIDLIKDTSAFKVYVMCKQTDGSTRPLKLALKKELVWELYEASHTCKVLTFSRELLYTLGYIFEKSMLR